MRHPAPHPDHPLENVFGAKHAYDAARGLAYGALADWANGRLSYDALQASMTRLEDAQRSLFDSVRSVSQYQPATPDLSVVAVRRFVAGRPSKLQT